MNLKLDLTLQEVQLVGHALGKLPYEAVAGLFAKIQKQVTEQQSGTERPA